MIVPSCRRLTAFTLNPHKSLGDFVRQMNENPRKGLQFWHDRLRKSTTFAVSRLHVWNSTTTLLGQLNENHESLSSSGATDEKIEKFFRVLFRRIEVHNCTYFESFQVFERFCRANE